MRQGWQRFRMNDLSGSERMSNRLYLVAAFAVIALTPSPAHAFWWRYGSIEEACRPVRNGGLRARSRFTST